MHLITELHPLPSAMRNGRKIHSEYQQQHKGGAFQNIRECYKNTFKHGATFSKYESL